jgi:rhodanese-related sulfurtransferase
LALTLIGKGVKNVFALKGGTQAWKEAGYPMQKSD